jgi:glucose-6-phosphate 1-epimerase
MQRQIRVSNSGSRSTVVWNPWIEKARAMPDFGDLEWRQMVCVETANVGSATVRLDPGATHTMTATISVQKASVAG